MCVCVCPFYSWHMAPSSTWAKGFLRWGHCTSGHSISASISILYMSRKWWKFDFIHLYVCVCVCVCERERVCVFMSDCLLTLFSIGLPSFTSCYSSSCPTRQLLLHLCLAQKPNVCPSHTAWDCTAHTYTHTHTHTHTLPNKHCCSGHETDRAHTVAQTAPETNSGWFSGSVIDRKEKREDLSDSRSVCAWVCVCVCACVRVLETVCAPSRQQLTGHQWKCQMIQGRGGRRRLPQHSRPAWPRWKAAATARSSSRATPHPSSSNAKTSWKRWDERLSDITPQFDHLCICLSEGEEVKFKLWGGAQNY